MRYLVMLTACLLMLGTAAMAQIWTDPAQAAADDPDFKIQGEYQGSIEMPGDPGTPLQPRRVALGLQVIALGDGNFDVVSWKGGLPGEPLPKHTPFRKRSKPVKGTRQGDQVTIDAGNEKLIIKDDVASVFKNDQLVMQLKKIHRQSKTLGKEPPADAVVLFDGTKATFEKHWQGKARMSDDGLLMQGAISKDKFTDFTMHIEFRLPYKPLARGQGRGNSGLYLQGRYEVQMLDSFGLSGKSNECGGIYGVAQPAVNMCYPPLTWQTYDIDFTAARFDENGKKTADARMTVYHNGVKIHDNVKLPGPTAAAKVKNEQGPGPIYLQDHGNPVRYRNIFVRPKE